MGYFSWDQTPQAAIQHTMGTNGTVGAATGIFQASDENATS
jgi:hypothetical protein